MAKNNKHPRRKQPKQTVTSPLRRRKQPKQTVTSPLRQSKQPQLIMYHLPFDLVAEILCRLPVKKLIQFRCVCKSWNSLISDDSNFAKKHLRLSTLWQGHRNLPTINTTIYSTGEAIMSKYKLEIGKYESSCDGILCYSMDDNTSAILYNPSIRKFKILPPLKFPEDGYTNRLYTLVYDRFVNNYKVIALNTYTREREVNVYTFGTDYWRRIQDFPSHDDISDLYVSGIYGNDSVNWVTKNGTEELIVSLDLEKESYQKLSLPVYDRQFTTSNKIPFVSFGRLRGCLSLLFYYIWNTFASFADVWIMKEVGNEKSWIKLFSVPYLKEWDVCHYTDVIHISEDDQLLMKIVVRNKFMLVVYDSINETFNFPKCLNKSKINLDMELEVNVESLISPL